MEVKTEEKIQPTNHNPPPEYINTSDLFKEAESQGLLVAIASKHQVKNGKDPKLPCINWDKNPKNYQGINDPKYGTAIRCDYINSLKSQLAIIDLDLPNPTKNHHLPIDVLKTMCIPIFEQTYCTETPSGGIHIYLLSKQRPRESQPKINIDYQTNTGIGKGKYIIADYRWNKKGVEKDKYVKIFQSPDKVAVVKNSDDVLRDIIQKLMDAGYVKTQKQEYWIEIAHIFKPYTKNRNSVNNFSLAIAGYLRKQGFDQQATEKIIQEIFKNSPEIQTRLNNVKQTYERPIKDIEGWQHIKDVLGKEDLDKLNELTRSENRDAKSKILMILSKNKEPTSKLLSDYVNTELELYKNLDTNKYYERTQDGQFIEIDDRRIIEFCNENFGVNSISSKRCYEVLRHITRPIKKNYNLLEFSNGILNTTTKSFYTDKTEYTETPKMTLNLEWNSTSQQGKIGNIIDKILDHPDHPNDKEKWFRSVGHAFMAYNRLGKLTMVQGASGTGKSTLTTILQRIFNYSNLPTSTINTNERFTLHGLIDKDINIDDDVNNGMLKGIGTLNTITTGNGLEVEIKGENKTIKAGNQQIPRLFANGNTLPPVLGEGFERRLLLIHAKNQIEYIERDEMLQNDILTGKYDKDGIEWLIYHSINTYWDKIDEPITSKEDEATMREDYEFKSYPLLKAIEAMFKENYTGLENIEVRKVNQYLKQWCKWAYNKGKISKEHRKPTNTQIKKAMNHAGYNQEIIKDGGITIRVYEDIEFKKGWNIIFNPENK